MNIIVTRYTPPTPEERATVPPGVGFPSDHWEGYIEPEDRSWIVFVTADHRPVVFLHRDPETGGVIDPEAVAA